MSINFDKNKLKELLMDFYTITNLRVIVLDDEFNKIIGYPEENSNLCHILKSNPKSAKLCKECDKAGCGMCKADNLMHIYTCHAGLTEVASPIKMNDTIIGYMMFGQTISPQNKLKNRKQIIEYCNNFFHDTELLERYFDELVCKTNEEIKAISKIMESCACYLWINQLINIDTESLKYRITSYIDNNLKGDLSVDTLCHVFAMSRSKLYEISKKHFGVSITRYVKSRRIKAATNLLSKNDCSVAEAAEHCGICDYNYFSKVFKSEMGCSPAVFKNNKL